MRTTIGDASSGSQRATGSSRPSRPSSTSSIVAAAVIGLLFDAIRKIVSRVIGGPSTSRAPTDGDLQVGPARHGGHRAGEPARPHVPVEQLGQ